MVFTWKRWKAIEKDEIFLNLYESRKRREKFFLYFIRFCIQFSISIMYRVPWQAPGVHVPKIDNVSCICIPVCSIRTSVSLPFRKQILIPRSLGPPGHHPRHSRVLPLFSVSRITPCCILRSSRNVIYTRRSLWRVSIFILVSQPLSENRPRSLHL